ncbi:hypothetical protein VTJ83DRAFT_6899 [Remersonia thermophila]|uniref:Cytochrome b5 heme-binding domain-containing protein n=1 Tax=Remersonia thermophila TaxID=72144 RepID=A0ABR4D878_9PEZI
MAKESSARRRKPAPQDEATDSSQDESAPKPTKTTAKRSDRSDAEQYEYGKSAIALDMLRVLTFLLLASCGLSYLVSNGESFFWGVHNPSKVLQPAWWLKQWRGPLYLTPAELARYDGTDPSKPIYLAINGTIYDVSSNPRTYGPGGSYHFFAGCDAARAYVTGCFAEDRTPDMRGVEEMYLPLDDPAVDKHWSPAELAELKKKEKEEALKKVHEALDHWVKFFRDSPKYEFVGYVKRPAGWPGTEPLRPLCKEAAKGRRKRAVPKKEDS